MPPAPTMQSPVYFFRQLLLMPPAERMKSLASRTPESRARILAKVHEYLALNADECELRLRATELRWYLTPLLQMPQTNRAERLAQVPLDLQKLVKSRLTEWDVLPPQLQQEFLVNEKTVNYVAHVETSNAPAASPQQQKIAEEFDAFLSLTPGEKRKLLGTLSVPERLQMEKTLQTFDQLPPQQRELCERNYGKFAGMSDAERAEFLKNAESWSKMSPQERQTWRELVAHIPLWPTPPAVPTHAAMQITKASTATN